MALYPTLEDMVVDQSQMRMFRSASSDSQYASSPFPQPSAPIYEGRNTSNPPPIYESIREFAAAKRALRYPSLPPFFLNSSADAPEPSRSPSQQDVASLVSGSTCTNSDGQIVLKSTTMIAPVTSKCTGLLRANVTHGVRQIVIGKNIDGKYGIRLRSINKGLFVQFVANNSPAAAAGVRFGDQILKLDDEEVLGMNAEKAMDLMTKSKNPDQLLITLRDRPFERAITLHKDDRGNLGFSHKENLITAIARDSSASRNGLLINQRILEVDGQNVMAFKTKEVKACLNEAPQTVTLTIMPAELYDELVRKMDWSLMKKQDHSIPDLPPN